MVLRFQGSGFTLALPCSSGTCDKVNRKLLVPHDHSGLCTRLRVTVYSLLKKLFGLQHVPFRGRSIAESPSCFVNPLQEFCSYIKIINFIRT